MSNYGFIAPCYDFILRPFLKNIRHDVLKIALSLKPERVLDVACGTGDQLRILVENRIRTVGIDLSEAMLRQCRQVNPAANCMLQDGTAMAFRESSFDLAMISFALHETGWFSAKSMIAEIRRILKPAGYLLIVDYADLKQVPLHVRRAIGIIEFMAGCRHYKNFRNYHRNGGLQALIDTNQFNLISTRNRASGSISAPLYQKLKM